MFVLMFVDCGRATAGAMPSPKPNVSAVERALRTLPGSGLRHRGTCCIGELAEIVTKHLGELRRLRVVRRLVRPLLARLENAGRDVRNGGRYRQPKDRIGG